MDKTFKLKKNLLAARLALAAFAIPIALLIGMAGVNEYQIRTGRELVLPIEGIDPRDFLSGRFLQYKINYGLKCPPPPPHPFRCKGARCAAPDPFRAAYICFEPEKRITVSGGKPANCSLFIKGFCLPKSREFLTGAPTRYYIPDRQAKQLERIFTKADKKSVVLSITKTGRIMTKEVLIDGKPLKSLVR